MPRKRHKPEEIVAKLRQVDVLTSQGQSAPSNRSDGHTSAGAEAASKHALLGILLRALTWESLISHQGFSDGDA